MEAGAIGIDIGSKNTVIAVVRKRGVEVVQSEGGQGIPTVVGMGDSARKLGEQAALSMKSNFQNTMSGFNRFLGIKQNSPKLKEELAFCIPKCVPCENYNIGFELRHQGEAKVFSPEQLMAMFFQKIRHTYESAGVGCNDIVVSIPPYFSAVERQAMLDAVKISGLNCVRLMNETTAIGLSYGLFRHSEFSEKPRNVVFLDLGYSKLTVSVMAFKNNQFQILAQGWEPNLGARDMDELIINMLVEDFQKKHHLNLRDSPKAIIRMREDIEKVRKILTGLTETPISIESIMDDQDIYRNFKREEFEALIEPLITRLTNLCTKVLKESKLDSKDIHSVEMVGEASRIPIVISKAKEVVGAPISRTMNSADCVARGCAIQCAMLSPLFKVKEYGIVDYNPFPVEVVYSLPKGEKETAEKKVRTLFDRACNFPVVKSLSFENRRDELELQLKHPSSEILPLGSPCLLGNYKINCGKPTEEKFTLSVMIALDHNMIAYVSGVECIEDYIEEKKIVVKRDAPAPTPPAKTEEKKEAKTETPEEKVGQSEKMEDTEKPKEAPPAPPAPAPEMEYEIQKIPKKRKTPLEFLFEVHGMGGKKITEAIEEEKKMGQYDKMIHDTHAAKNSLESYIYEIKGRLNDDLRSFVDPQQVEKILEYFEKAENWFNSEGFSQPKAIYEEKLKDLQKLGDPVKKRFQTFINVKDLRLLVNNAHEKAFIFIEELKKIEHITEADKDELRNLIASQQKWLVETDAYLATADKTKDFKITENDFHECVRKIEELKTKLEKKPKPEVKKEEVKKEAKKEEVKKEESPEPMKDTTETPESKPEKMQS